MPGLAKYATMAYKLQTAIQNKGKILRLETTQFYSDDRQRLIKLYHVVDNDIKNKRDAELLCSPSLIEVIKYLGNYLKNMEGDTE